MGSVAYFDKHSVRIKVCKIAYRFKHSIVLNGLALLDSTRVQFLCSESIDDWVGT